MKQTIGLVGFGIVGEGVYELVSRRSDPEVTIKKVCVKDREKVRKLPQERLCYDIEELLNDEEINLVVEVINDPGAALYIAEKSLRKGKSVISANKKMVAEKLPGLISYLGANGNAFLYEGSTCGSIPIIRNLEEYYVNDNFISLYGILNGSANFILSRICADGMDYNEALSLARLLGFAEADPWLDVSGEDTLNKLVILAVHSIGKWVDPAGVFCYGIQNISREDIDYAGSGEMKIRLTGNIVRSGNSFSLFVMPRFIKKENPLYDVENEYNALVIEGEQCSMQVLSGKGAGKMPTATAVMSDIDARTAGYRYRYKKMRNGCRLINDDVLLNIYLRTGSREIMDLPGSPGNNKTCFRNGSYFYEGNITLSNLGKIRDKLLKSDSFVAFF